MCRCVGLGSVLFGGLGMGYGGDQGTWGLGLGAWGVLALITVLLCIFGLENRERLDSRNLRDPHPAPTKVSKTPSLGGVGGGARSRLD